MVAVEKIGRRIALLPEAVFVRAGRNTAILSSVMFLLYIVCVYSLTQTPLTAPMISR
jgi:hypothetical protein